MDDIELVKDKEFEISGSIHMVKGEIPTSMSSFGSTMQLPAGLNFSSLTAREWFQGRRQHLKPWLIFISTSGFKIPQNPQTLSKRLVKNIEYFQSNYMFVFIGLILYCLLMSPLLLVAVAAFLGGCYLVAIKNAEKKLAILGYEPPLAQQYAVVAVFSVPMFYLAGASSALFWVIGASFFVIMLHATFYNIESLVGHEDQPFDLQMEEV